MRNEQKTEIIREYMTVKALAEEFGYARQTIYNKIHLGEFVKNIHFYKPSPNKILFLRSVFIQYLEGGSEDCVPDDDPPRKPHSPNGAYFDELISKSAINI